MASTFISTQTKSIRFCCTAKLPILLVLAKTAVFEEVLK